MRILDENDEEMVKNFWQAKYLVVEGSPNQDGVAFFPNLKYAKKIILVVLNISNNCN